MGKYKNKKVVVKHVDTDEYGDLRINHKAALRYRTPKPKDEPKEEPVMQESKTLKMMPLIEEGQASPKEFVNSIEKGDIEIKYKAT